MANPGRCFMNTFPNPRLAALNLVIASAVSGERAYLRAASRCRDPHLQSLLRYYAEDCAAFVRELEACAESAGSSVNGSAAPTGALAAWSMLDAAIRENDDFTILQECERSESHAQRLYMETLRATPGSPAHDIVERLAFVTQAHLDRLRQLTTLFAQVE